MSTYVFGDIQGCFDELMELLFLIHYNETKDALWFAGDLVNRGPKSLEVLRFIQKTPNTLSVLGNHDLMLLVMAYTDKSINNHTLNDILVADDREILLTWLRTQPLIYIPKHFPYALVHAGIPPQWSLSDARRYASEIEFILSGPDYLNLLTNLLGNEPDLWKENLPELERYRYTINALTRMRYCDQEGRLDLHYKGNIENAPAHLQPWFAITDRKTKDDNIIFGHWASLKGNTQEPNIYPLDTGCVWGGCLTAMRLEDGKKFTVNCQPDS